MTWLLKECVDECMPLVAPLVTSRINTLLTEGRLPCAIKVAVIKPRFKSLTVTMELSTATGLSLTYFSSKLLQKVVMKQLDDHYKATI